MAGDLDALQAAEFLVARDAKATPRFAFRHILMEEVTYRGLLSPRRQEIHHAIVQAMEQLYAGRIEHYAELIAWHAAKAEMWDRAIVHNRRAALKAIDRRADPAAIRCIGQALDALTRLPERTSEVIGQEIELRLLLRISLGALGRYEWWAENLDIAERLAQELGDVRRLLAIRVARLHVLNTHGRIDHGIAACRQAEETARAHGDPHQTVAATYFLAQAHNWHGAFADGVAALDRAQPTLDLLPRDSRCGMTGTARLMYEARSAPPAMPHWATCKPVSSMAARHGVPPARASAISNELSRASAMAWHCWLKATSNSRSACSKPAARPPRRRTSRCCSPPSPGRSGMRTCSITTRRAR